MDSDHIFQKEEVYRTQMAEIRAIVLDFAQSKGWHPFSRGRRAHVSIFGKINNLDGVLDVIMEEDNWNTMPAALLPETQFLLLCSGNRNVQEPLRRYGDTQLFWRAPFSILPETVNRFLPVAWGMLSGMNESNLRKDSFPFVNPDLPPDFGPPRKWPGSSQA